MGFVRISGRVRSLENDRLPPLETDMKKLRDNGWTEIAMVLPTEPGPAEVTLLERIAALEKRLDDPRLKLPKLFQFEGVLWGPPAAPSITTRLEAYCPYCYEKGILTAMPVQFDPWQEATLASCSRSVHAGETYGIPVTPKRFSELAHNTEKLRAAVEAHAKS